MVAIGNSANRVRAARYAYTKKGTHLQILKAGFKLWQHLNLVILICITCLPKNKSGESEKRTVFKKITTLFIEIREYVSLKFLKFSYKRFYKF